MNRSFRIGDNLPNKISFYHLMLLMASMPFDMFYSYIVLISFAAHTLIHLNRNVTRPIIKGRTLVLQSVFFVSLLSAVYTVNAAGASNEIGRRAIICYLPILFCLNPVDLKKYRPKLLLAFALVCTLIVACLYMDAFFTIRHYQLPVSIIFSNYFTNHNFSEPIHMHATFFSMQLALALVSLVTALLNEHRFYRRLFYLACIALLAAGLIQLSSKSVCIAVLAIVNVAVPYFLLQGAKRRKFVLISASFSVLLVSGICYSTNFRTRYVTEFTRDLSPDKAGDVLDSRVERWKVALELIGKAPLKGYGAGSETALLHDSFFDHQLYSSFLNNLNAHNQYLSFLLKSGIAGLLIYIVTLVFGFKRAFLKKDLLFFT
ncbi:MAG: O-antigen ligase family protein, partial [Mucilaginibacter sp.]